MPVEGVNGILNVESAALHAPQVGVANTNPQHILSVGSNLYVSGDSSDVLTVDGNVVCEGVKVGLIEIIPSYDLEAVANVGNSTSNTIQFTNPDTGIVTTGNVSVGKTLTVEGIRITAATEADVDLDAVVAAGSITTRSIQLQGDADSTGPYTGTLQIGTAIDAFGGLGVAGNVHVGRGVYAQDLVVDGDTLVVDSTNHQVGIGKTNPDATLDVDGDAIIRGDLSVLGTTTTIDTDHLRVQDPIIELGKDNTTSPGVDLGLIMTRPSGSSNVAVIFDEDTDTLKIGYTNGGASDTTITMDSAPLSVNVNGNLSVTSNLEVGTANLFVDTTNSRVGVGTSIPTESLDVVGNMNLQQVSNVASIKLNSNVVTEFPRSKKLIKYPRVAMSGPSAPTGYVASASRENDGRDAYTAFDGDDTTYWQIVNDPDRYDTSGNATSDATLFEGDNGEWIKILLPDKVKISSIRRRATNSTRRPTNCKLYGSNDNTAWDLLEDITFSNTDWADGNVNTNNYYNYFVLQVLTVSGNGKNVDMKEFELYGTPEYDPDADGVDVVVKSVPNVPNTDWLEVYYDAKNYTSGVVQDLSTNSFDGTLTNGASFNNSDGIDKFVFDGTNDYISGSIPSTFTGNQTYTFSIWVKPNSHPSSGFVGVFEVGTRSNDDAMGLYFDTGKIIHLAYADNLATTTYATIGEWVHITGTYTSGDRRVYANGNLLKQDDYSDLTLAGTTFKLGSNLEGTQAFDGSIANFRLFNRALTSDEIYQLYAYQKEYFGHGDLGMTLKAGRLGIGTSEPRAALDVRGSVNLDSLLAGATGGIETEITDQNISYKVHSFTSTGTSQIIVHKGGLFECLVVAGGGAGGQSNGAGGGAGGVVIQTVFVHAGTYNVVVGAGNTSGTRNPGYGSTNSYSQYPTGKRGENSNVFNLLAIGGGNGGGDDYSGVDGGSGGGCADDNDVIPGRGVQNQEGSNGYGNRGGYTHLNNKGGAGGGGAGEVGFDIDPDLDRSEANSTWTLLGRDGGNGVGSTIRTGSMQYYGGGGGGAERTTADTDVPGAGIGGKGGGGNGAGAEGAGSAGSANTGGGGGGSSGGAFQGGDGGSGIVVVRYRI